MATTEAETGAEGLEFKTVLKIRWRSSSEYLTTEKSAEPEAASKATTSTVAGGGACVAAEVRVQR